MVRQFRMIICREMRGFSNSDAAPLLGTLLTAYQEGDEEAVHKACDDVLFRTMDNEVLSMFNLLLALV